MLKKYESELKGKSFTVGGESTVFTLGELTKHQNPTVTWIDIEGYEHSITYSLPDVFNSIERGIWKLKG